MCGTGFCNAIIKDGNLIPASLAATITRILNVAREAELERMGSRPLFVQLRLCVIDSACSFVCLSVGRRATFECLRVSVRGGGSLCVCVCFHV